MVVLSFRNYPSRLVQLAPLWRSSLLLLVGSAVQSLIYLLVDRCIHYNSMKQLLNNGVIPLNYVRPKMNLVDRLMKPLSKT